MALTDFADADADPADSTATMLSLSEDLPACKRFGLCYPDRKHRQGEHH